MGIACAYGWLAWGGRGAPDRRGAGPPPDEESLVPMGLGALAAKLGGDGEPPPSFAQSRDYASSGEDEWDALSEEELPEQEPEPEPELSRGDSLRSDIRRELEEETLGGLNRSALRCGVDSALIADAQDHDSADDIKDAMIALMMTSEDYRSTDPRLAEAAEADIEDNIREDLEPLSLGLLVRRARADELVSEDAMLEAQDEKDPHYAMVELLVKAEAQAKAIEEESGAAVIVQARYRGFKSRKEVEQRRARALLKDDDDTGKAKAQWRKTRLAEELAALQRGDSILPTASESSRSLMLPPDQKVSMMRSPGNTRGALSEGVSLSAEGIRRTERVAAELFALRKGSDAAEAERSIYTSGSPRVGPRGGGLEESLNGYMDRSLNGSMGGRARVSGIQAELARSERAARRSTLERELEDLQSSFRRKLGSDGTAGEVVLDASRTPCGTPRRGGGGFDGVSAVGAEVGGLPRGTPRQRVATADRRAEKLLAMDVRQQESAVKIQTLYRGHKAKDVRRQKVDRRQQVRSCKIGKMDQERKLPSRASRSDILPRHALMSNLLRVHWASRHMQLSVTAGDMSSVRCSKMRV